MSQVVVYDGVEHEFPDDATDQEISAALGGGESAPTDTGTPPTLAERGWGALKKAGLVGLPFEQTPVGKMHALAQSHAPLRDRISAGVDAASGFAMGPLGEAGVSALPKVAEAAAPVVRDVAAAPAAIAQRVKPAPVAGATGEVPAATAGIATASPAASKAEDLLYQNLIESGWTPEKIQERLKWLGPGGTLADLEPFAGRAEASAQFPAAQKRAQRVLGSRQRGAENRLLTTVDNTLSPENYYESLDYLRATRSADAQPLRQQALNQAAGKPIKSDMIQRLQKDSPYFSDAMAEGKKLVKEESAREGIEIPTTETWFHGTSFEDPNVTTMREPTLRMLDAAKQGYQALLKPYRNQYTGMIDKADPKAVELSKTVEKLTDTMRQASPTYAKYLDAWSEPSQQMDALARGRKVLDNDPEVTSKIIRNATPNELMDMQTGLARALKDKISNDPQSAVRLFRKGPVLDKMRQVFPDSSSFRTLHRQVLRESQKQQTANRNLVGSNTMRRKLGAEGIANDESSMPEEAVGAALDVGTGNHSGLLGRAKRLASRWVTSKPDLAPDVADELSSVLHNTDPIVQQRMIQRFRARSMPPQEMEPLP